MNRIIDLMVNRQPLKIPAKSVLYATVTDKLCKIYLDNQEVLNLFVTISELMEKLGEEHFLRVSRSGLVAYSAIEAVSRDEIVLNNGMRVLYSRSRRKEIAQKVKYHMSLLGDFQGNDQLIRPIDFPSEFEFWNTVPVAFGVLEFLRDSSGKIDDFTFRYANQAFAAIEGVSLETLVSLPFGALFPEAKKKWLTHYMKVAFQGEVVELIEHVPELGKDLFVICYQPSYGYCACIITDASNKYYLQVKKNLVM